VKYLARFIDKREMEDDMALESADGLIGVAPRKR
jgi:hypothetical protein